MTCLAPIFDFSRSFFCFALLLDDEDLLEELLEELLEVLPEELLDELLEESELISPDSRSLDFRISSLFCFVVLQSPLFFACT